MVYQHLTSMPVKTYTLALVDSMASNFLGPFRNVITKLNEASTFLENPPVTCIVSDVFMSFPVEAAEEFGIPIALLCTMSACVLMIYLHCQHLESGILPLKDKSDLTNEYLNMPVNLIPGNTQLRSIGSNLWVEDQQCIQWLDIQELNSIVYVNFGSHTVMTTEQLIEFAWGLANSKQPFLWVIRFDLVIGKAAIFRPEFTQETADWGMISSSCPQEQVLSHSSTGGFLTHSGWNSTMDTISGGVPVISWPFFGDQQTNCREACVHWGIGMEIDNNVKRDDVEGLVRELMEGEKGKVMKKKAMEWKKRAEDSTEPSGSSYVNLDNMINEVLIQKELV
ncbi:hypothetical protein IFM89_019413 [Coptis chinensis]|uniref:Uncharacterized protein n=1 Tax=Coptis chinensis TaxID=261450 RepID=A0A835IRG9_9MAGN|nr:hypothetical protein IFM89_019413 [Coptis chinensis]